MELHCIALHCIGLSYIALQHDVLRCAMCFVMILLSAWVCLPSTFTYICMKICLYTAKCSNPPQTFKGLCVFCMTRVRLQLTDRHYHALQAPGKAALLLDS